jgi:dipeptidyl aminopeptidase/acylaminoacyl peptidase
MSNERLRSWLWGALILATSAGLLGACNERNAKRVAQRPALLAPPPPPVAQPAMPARAGAAPGASTAAPALEITFRSRGLLLYGYITKPPGNGPFPAILYNHGSERAGGQKDPLRKFWSEHGFVFFLPHRSGHGKSQGQYFEDKGKDHSRLIRHIEEHAEEVSDGVAYMRRLPYVDKNRMIVGGCSYGGIQTVLAAERGDGLKAALDFAGGAESWASDRALHQRMKRAVDHARIPIFFIQAENDYNTEPTKVLGAEAQRAHKDYKAKIFPAYGTSHSDGHGGFCAHQSATWERDVLQWVRKYI